MDKPTFSIIIINPHSNYLHTILESVYNQDFKKWECLIVMNNDIHDNNKKVITDWIEKDNRFQYSFDFPIDVSEGYIKNQTVKDTTGDYILFFDNNSIFHNNNVLSEISKYIQPANEIIHGDLLDSQAEKLFNHFNIDNIIKSDLNSQTIFIKREVFQKYTYFNEDLQYTASWDFFYRLICFKRPCIIHAPIVIAKKNKQENKDIVYSIYSEKENVIKETMSLEMFEIFSAFNNYSSFYHKKIFTLLRRIKNLKNNIFSLKSWSEYIYKKRLMFIIRIINKKVREQEKDPLSIPVIIINYNRLADLKQLVSFLISRNHKNIVIIDNKSTYPPLLEYYNEIKGRVTIKIMDVNYGHLVFWRNREIYSLYSDGYHIVTDFDILPNSNLPEDYVQQLINILNNYKTITKVGFALKIDDVIVTNERKRGAVEWEKRFWEKPLGNNMYLADIDTTFALYPPCYKFNFHNFYKAIRIAGDFTSRHGGFYIDDENPTVEDIYYIQTANNSSTLKRYIVTDKIEK